MRRRLAAVAVAAASALLAAHASPALAVSVTAKAPSQVEGSAFTTTVASFVEPAALALTCPAPAPYGATVTWGDGSASTGTVSGGTLVPLVGCAYNVDATHDYAEEGTVSYSVAVTGPVAPGNSGPSALVVRDGALNAKASGFPATQNTPGAATVATFTDANPGAAPSDFTALVSWGDGTSGPGAVAAAPGGGFAVTASHSYLHSGIYPLSVTIADAGGSKATANATANVVPTATGQPPAVTPSVTPPRPLRLGLSSPLLARGGTIIVAVRCPVAAKLCRGKLVVAALAAPHARVPALRAATPLGTALFFVPGGRRAELSIRPKRGVVALLRRAGLVKVAVFASSFDAATGRAQVASLTAKLRLAPH